MLLKASDTLSSRQSRRRFPLPTPTDRGWVGPTWPPPLLGPLLPRLPHTAVLEPGARAPPRRPHTRPCNIWPGRYRAGATQPREPGAPSHPHSPRRVGPVAATPVKRDPHTCCTAPRLRSVLCGRQLCAPRCGRSVPVLRRLSLNSRI